MKIAKMKLPLHFFRFFLKKKKQLFDCLQRQLFVTHSSVRMNDLGTWRFHLCLWHRYKYPHPVEIYRTPDPVEN